MFFSKKLEKLLLPQLVEIQNNVLWSNIELSELDIRNVEIIGEYFLGNNEKLKRIDSTGGIKKQNLLAKEKADYFRNKIKNLPLKMFTDEKCSSNCVTTLCPVNENINAYKVFEILKDEYEIWICPNGGDLAQKLFRVGHIGAISKDEIDKLIFAFEDLVKRGLL